MSDTSIDTISSAELLAALHLTGEHVQWVHIDASLAVYAIETEVDGEKQATKCDTSARVIWDTPVTYQE